MPTALLTALTINRLATLEAIFALSETTGDTPYQLVELFGLTLANGGDRGPSEDALRALSSRAIRYVIHLTDAR